jgi:hypothetical protein
MANYDSKAGRSPLARHVAVIDLDLPAQAAANTDFSLSLPSGAELISLRSRTSTAFTGTTATVQVGLTVGGAELVAATSIKALGEVAHSLVGAVAADVASSLSMGSASPNLFVRVVQTGPTAVGQARLLVEYGA